MQIEHDFFLRIWGTVTEYLKKNDLEKANEAKIQVEERQRMMRKQIRVEDWTPRLFVKKGDEWVYIDSK